MTKTVAMRHVNKIVLASLNEGKLREFQVLFKDYPEVELVSPQGILRNAEKLPFAEQYDTYLENSSAKARLANQGCHYPTLADDSGLEVDALNGAPGVRSHRYAKGPAGSAPLSRMEQDRANMELLLSEMKKNPQAGRGARFVTTLALQIEGILLHATGVLEGTIAEGPRGNQGFGYDPIFIPKGSDKTLAEMTREEKNQVSHRAMAVRELMKQVKAHGIVFAKP